MPISNEMSSIPGLFGDAIEQLGTLVRSEVRLARAEMSEKVTQAATGIAYVAAAGVIMIPVLVMLLTALALWLTQMGISPVASYLIAAAIGAVLSVMLGLGGLNRLKPARLTPTVTIHQVDRDMVAARELAK